VPGHRRWDAVATVTATAAVASSRRGPRVSTRTHGMRYAPAN